MKTDIYIVYSVGKQSIYREQYTIAVILFGLCWVYKSPLLSACVLFFLCVEIFSENSIVEKVIFVLLKFFLLCIDAGYFGWHIGPVNGRESYMIFGVF